MTPTTSEAMTSARIQSPKLAVELKPEVVPPPENFRTSSKAMKPPSMIERAVGHVDDPHEPEDEREAARDDEVEARRA